MLYSELFLLSSEVNKTNETKQDEMRRDKMKQSKI